MSAFDRLTSIQRTPEPTPAEFTTGGKAVLVGTGVARISRRGRIVGVTVAVREAVSVGWECRWKSALGLKEAVGVWVTVSVGVSAGLPTSAKMPANSWSGMRGLQEGQHRGALTGQNAQTPGEHRAIKNSARMGQRNLEKGPGETALGNGLRLVLHPAAAVPVLHFGLLVGLLAGYPAGDLIRHSR